MAGDATSFDPVYIGIDPGKSGAIAVFRPRAGRLDVFDMPTVTVKKNGREKTELSPVMLANQMNDLRYLSTATQVILEQVGAMPGQGVSSMFNFGHSTGTIMGVLGAMGIPCTLVTPQAWKKTAGLIGTDKDAARARAIQLWPTWKELHKKGKGQALADAALIAQHGDSK